MPGAPSFIALDWGTSSLRAWRFGESPNPQENVNSPGDHEITLPGSNT